MSTDATDIRCAECGRDITHATSIYLVSGRYVCDICYVRLTASRDCKHGHLARSCEICQLEADNAALRVLVEEHEELKAKLQARVAELEAALREAVKHWRELRSVDMTPNAGMPYRILRGYLDYAVWTDNTAGMEPTNPIIVQMNKDRIERNAIIERALAALAQSPQPGGDHE